MCLCFVSFHTDSFYSFMETLTDEEIGQGLSEVLKQAMNVEVPELKSINVTRWHTNPYTRGTYSFRTLKADKAGLSADVISDNISITTI